MMISYAYTGRRPSMTCWATGHPARGGHVATIVGGKVMYREGAATRGVAGWGGGGAGAGRAI